MKTAVSLPDDIFTGAEMLAKRLKVSRNQLYAKALDEYVSRHAPDAITKALDRVCKHLGTNDENEFVLTASRRILEKTEW